MFSFSPQLSAFTFVTRSGMEEADAQVVAVRGVVRVAVAVVVDVRKVRNIRRLRRSQPPVHCVQITTNISKHSAISFAKANLQNVLHLILRFL